MALPFNSVSVLVSEAAPSESDQMLGEVDALSVELKHYIQEDNWRFEQEVEEWEEEQSCKIPQMESSSSSASQDFSPSPGAEVGGGGQGVSASLWSGRLHPALPEPSSGASAQGGPATVCTMSSSGVAGVARPAEELRLQDVLSDEQTCISKTSSLYFPLVSFQGFPGCRRSCDRMNK